MGSILAPLPSSGSSGRPGRNRPETPRGHGPRGEADTPLIHGGAAGMGLGRPRDDLMGGVTPALRRDADHLHHPHDAVPRQGLPCLRASRPRVRTRHFHSSGLFSVFSLATEPCPGILTPSNWLAPHRGGPHAQSVEPAGSARQKARARDGSSTATTAGSQRSLTPARAGGRRYHAATRRATKERIPSCSTPIPYHPSRLTVRAPGPTAGRRSRRA